LIGDADRGDVVCRRVHGIHGLGHHRGHVVADLGCVVLDPSGAWEMLAVLALPAADDLAGMVEQDGARTRRALVDGNHIARCHACTHRSSRPDASAASQNPRSREGGRSGMNTVPMRGRVT
jgi:hypothetical protein